MMILYILFFFIVFVILAALIWRVFSSKTSIPCPTWLSWMVELDNPFSTMNRAATIIKHLELKPGMSVIDVGCGPGRVTIPAARAVGEQGKVVAMDMQKGMLDKLREKAQKENRANITFVHAGIGHNTLEHNIFDRALLVTVLGEIPDQKAALQEIFNALKPGGMLLVAEIIADPHFQRRSTVRSRATAVGFREKECFGSCLAYIMQLEKP